MSTVPDYQARATEHRPRGLEETRAAVLRMRAENHSDYAIATALGVHVEAVRRLAGCRDCE